MMWGVGEDDTKGKHDPHTTVQVQRQHHRERNFSNF